MVTDPIAFTLGPFAIRWYGILIMLGVLAGSYLAATLARRKGESADHLWNMVPFVVFTAIVGARLYWVLLSWNTCCANNPVQALNIRAGGISIHGAIVFGILAIWLYTRFNRLPFFRWLDIIAPAMALGQAIGRWGNFANQEAFGNPTTLPWGIPILPQNRPPAYAAFERFHPTFWYESIYNLLVCLGLTALALRIGRDRRLRDGDALWVYLILYALGRFAIETLRTDSLFIGPFKAAHLASAVALLAGLLGLFLRHRNWRGDAEPAPATGEAPSAPTSAASLVGDSPAPAAEAGATAMHRLAGQVGGRRGT
jgi:phosphatidylglycerol:prolipoprotein diacylglycerol transferase